MMSHIADVPAPARVSRGRLSIRKSLVGAIAAVALALGGALAAPTIANAEGTTSLELSAVPAEGSLTVDATVSNLPSGSPGAYVALIEEGTVGELSQSNMGLGAKLIKASEFVAGVGTTSLTVDASDLDRSKFYEAVAWQHMTSPSSETIYAVTKLGVTSEQWDVVFPVVYTPELSASPSADLDPVKDTVTVTGTGYNPGQAIYVFLCSDIELPADLFAHAMGCRDGAKVVYEHGAVKTDGSPQPLQFDSKGNFSIQFDVRSLDAAATAVFTAANHTSPSDRGQDAKVVLGFVAPAQGTAVELNVPEGSVYGDAVKFSATVSPIGAEGTVTFFVDEQQVGNPQTVLLGAANVSTSELESGTHEITARFTPKNGKAYLASTSEERSVTVAKRPTSINLSKPASVVFGSDAEIEASVTPATEGTVEFFHGEQSIGVAEVVDGAAGVAASSLNAGTYDITAHFTPADESNFEESASEAVTLTVDEARTVTEVIAPKTVEFGVATLLSARVSPTASGSVEFYIDGEQIGAAVPVIDGMALSEMTPMLNSDIHVPRAVFTSNDSNYLGSEGSAEIRTVDHDLATVIIKNGEQKIEPGTTVLFEVGEFAEDTDVTGVIDPETVPEESENGTELEEDKASAISLQASVRGIDLGMETVGTNGFAAFEFTIPAGFEGQHTAVFTTVTGTEAAVNFVVEAAAADTAGSGADGSGTGADAPVADAGANASGASASTQNPQGASSSGAAHPAGDRLASTGGEDLAGVSIAALFALIAGACIMTMRRRVNR